jgi:hypothetical protein
MLSLGRDVRLSKPNSSPSYRVDFGTEDVNELSLFCVRHEFPAFNLQRENLRCRVHRKAAAHNARLRKTI